ncbi:MAG: hypothetical protein A2252_04170 [Elusimicrobia bacterium RIFOXYA2_FULL_39_19]|nr:MAG: hypothetical protein A2252_04170 [Elusimicrobia bacterium RIFOXYA2_FULL_39_19]
MFIHDNYYSAFLVKLPIYCRYIAVNYACIFLTYRFLRGISNIPLLTLIKPRLKAPIWHLKELDITNCDLK